MARLAVSVIRPVSRLRYAARIVTRSQSLSRHIVSRLRLCAGLWMPRRWVQEKVGLKRLDQLVRKVEAQHEPVADLDALSEMSALFRRVSEVAPLAAGRSFSLFFSN